MTRLEKANYSYCVEAIKQKKHIENNFWILAQMLYKIKSQRLYENGWSTWTEYCMEFKGLSQRSIDKIIQIYKVMVVENQIGLGELKTSGGWAVLAEAIPHIKSKEDAHEWIEKSSYLSLSDIRKEIKERKTGISMVECKHHNTYTIRVCDDCGERIRVYEDN